MAEYQPIRDDGHVRLVEFGDGGVVVSRASLPGQPQDELILADAGGPHPTQIGDTADPSPLSSDDPHVRVRMIFRNRDSLDVVIEELQTLRDCWGVAPE